MSYQHWKIDDLPWDQFQPNLVNPEVLKVVKTAAVVEYGGNNYARYLQNVFSDDPAVKQSMQNWALEEVQHGQTLGRYAELADPTFNLKQAYTRFTAGYNINTEITQSVRGSQAGELISRCIVETGTSSYYTALADAVEEPLLKAICRQIAADELRHYKLFYGYLKHYLGQQAMSQLDRLKIGLGRVHESEDDELAYAYFAANAPLHASYDRAESTAHYMARAYRFYKPEHVERIVAMIFKACGLKPHTVWHGMASRVAWWVLNGKTRRAQQKVAA